MTVGFNGMPKVGDHKRGSSRCANNFRNSRERCNERVQTIKIVPLAVVLEHAVLHETVRYKGSEFFGVSSWKALVAEVRCSNF